MNRSSTQGLLLLFLFALALRAATVWLLWDAANPPFTYEHGEIASNLVQGRGFAVRFLGAEGPTSQQAPFYPVLLAASYACLGLGEPTALLAIQLAQCVAGAATAVLIARIAWSVIPRRTLIGWTAGCLAAIHPVLLYSATQIQVAVWATLGLASVVAVATSTIRPVWWKALCSGSLFGAILLVEPIFAVTLPVFVWLAVRDRTANDAGSGVIRASAVFLAAMAICLAPWLYRNIQVHREFVFVKSTFGYAFWQGNNQASWGTDKIPKPYAETLRLAHNGSPRDIERALWEARHETLYIDDVLITDSDYRYLSPLSEPARSRVLLARAWNDIQRQPTRYVRLCGQRWWYFLGIDATNPKAANRCYQTLTMLWLFSVVAGLIALGNEYRRTWPIMAVFVAIMMFHSLTITAPRFRIPIEALSLIWSAAALTAACSWVHAGWQLLSAASRRRQPARPHVAFGQQRSILDG